MEENIWKYGQHELDKKALLKYLQSNAESYIEYQGYDDNQKKQFNSALGHIISGIENGTISGNGLGKFTEKNIDLGEDDVTKYINTVANAMGEKFSKKKEEKKEQIEEKPEELEDFDYSKHGLYYSFNKENNPFGTDSNYDLWKSKYTTQDELNTALADYIGQHRTKIGETKRNWKQIDQEHYNSMLSDLENDIRTNGIQDSDKLKLKSLGFNPDSFILSIKEEKQGFQGEGNKVNPFGHIDFKTELTKEEQAALQQQEAEKIAQMPMSEYIGQDWTESDKLRLKALGMDVISIVDPEPISAAGLGFYSDYLNQQADELEGGDFGWDDVTNYAISAVGAIPIFGDVAKGANLIKKIGKLTNKLMPVISAFAIGQGIENGDEIITSAKNILVNHDFSKVEDWRNLSTALQFILGGTNTYRNIKGKAKAVNINDNTEEALVVSIKNKGKTEDYQFSGKDREELLSKKDNPEEFSKYIRDNFEGLENAEVTNIKKEHEWSRTKEDGTKTILPHRKVKSQEVQTQTKSIYEELPSKWTRARHFMDSSTSAKKPTKKDVATESQTNKPTKSEEVTYNTSTGKYETVSEKQKSDQKIADDNILNELSKAESGINKKPEERKVETSKSKKEQEESKSISFEEARKVASEKKSETTPVTEIKPNIQSKVTESANIKSKVTKYNASDIRKEFEKLKGKYKKKVRFIAKNAKQDKELADLVKQDPSLASKDFNEMLAALQKADNTTYEQAFKMLTEAGFYKEGGIIKAQNGVKTGTPRNNNPWYSNVGNLFMDDLLQGLKSGKYTYQDINIMQDRHYGLDKKLGNNVENPTFNQDVQQYYNDINNHFSFVNNKGIKAGEDTSRYKILQNPNTGDTFNGQWKADGYYSGRGQDRMLLGKQGDYSEDELNKTIELWKNNGYEMYLDPETNYYKLKEHNFDYDAGSLPEVVITPENSTTQYPGGPKTPPKEPNKIEKPEKPNQSFFTPDKALAALNYFRALGHNKEQLDLANRMVPLLYDPMEHHRSVYGNLRAIAEGNKAAGEVRNLASRPATSDGSLWLAGRLEGENLAQQYIRQGWQSDDETMRQMSELAWQQEKENHENRYNIAMKNRENMHQVSKEKLMALMGKKRADYESGTNFINEWRTWINAKQQTDKENANLLFNKEILNYVTNNPQEYIPNWKLYEKLWNRYNNGETLSADEQRTISQIQNHLSNAYYNEIYGKGDYLGYGITRAPWKVKFDKKGGTITKHQVDSIIKYLKESNNNYNKAIDRSVRGLYNHIKLQRKK